MAPPNADALLDELLTNPIGQAASASGPPTAHPPALVNNAPRWPSGAAKGIGKVSYTHDAMIDMLIANPMISQGELALTFGYTQGWISQVISSDAFQAKFNKRTETLVDPIIRRTAEERFKGLMLRSMEILEEKLNKSSEAVPDQLALRSLELTSRALGYGAKTEQKVEVNLHTHLEELGGNLVQLLRRKRAESEAPLDAVVVGSAVTDPTSAGS